jgi:hypothetical protein
MSDQDIHVMPVGDLREHICSPDCPCKPTAEVIGAVLKYSHNAWDGREYVEAVEEFLGISEEV